MRLRNINHGQRNPQVVLDFTGMRPRTDADADAPWPGSVHVAVRQSDFHFGFHMTIAEAKLLQEELAEAIADAGNS